MATTSALLAEAFTNRASQEMGRSVGGISPDAYQVLKCYHWPGNVRELNNVIRRVVAMTRATTISLDDLPDELVTSSGRSTGAEGEAVGFFAERAAQTVRFEWLYVTDLLTRHLPPRRLAARGLAASSVPGIAIGTGLGGPQAPRRGRCAAPSPVPFNPVTMHHHRAPHPCAGVARARHPHKLRRRARIRPPHPPARCPLNGQAPRR